MLLTLCLYKTAKILRYYIEPCSGQTKDDKISICCFSTKHAILRSKGKDLLSRNNDNVSEWENRPIHGLFFSVN